MAEAVTLLLRRSVFAVMLASVPAIAEQPAWVDARVATYARYFQHALLPGVPGAVIDVESAAPVMANVFVRFGAVDLPGAQDSLSGEVFAWGAIGPFAPAVGLAGDGDVTSAWAQARTGALTVKLGRQVALPSASRFVRFDGATLRLTGSMVSAELYGGWVTLPRWNQPRGYSVLGFVGDALKSPELLEAQNRVGQFVVGGKVGLDVSRVRASLGFHEQHDLLGVAMRWVSAELKVTPMPVLLLGANASFDLISLTPAHVRAWVDLTAIKHVGLSLDYGYQSPALLLPSTSVLAVFGGASWHEVGFEVSWRVVPTLKLVGRASGQAFEGFSLGGRGNFVATWVPDLDARWQLMGEVSRLLVEYKGYVQGRAGARVRLTTALSATADAAAFHYDVPINGVSWSLTGVGAVEWQLNEWLRVLVSTTVLTSPFAAFEAQGMGRIVIEPQPVSAGNGA